MMFGLTIDDRVVKKHVDKIKSRIRPVSCIERQNLPDNVKQTLRDSARRVPERSICTRQQAKLASENANIPSVAGNAGQHDPSHSSSTGSQARDTVNLPPVRKSERLKHHRVNYGPMMNG